MPEYEAHLVLYNPQHFDAETYNNLFQCLMTLNFMKTGVSAHRMFFVVPDWQRYWKTQANPEQADTEWRWNEHFPMFS